MCLSEAAEVPCAVETQRKSLRQGSKLVVHDDGEFKSEKPEIFGSIVEKVPVVRRILQATRCPFSNFPWF